MTIDERIEALTLTMELLAGMHKDLAAKVDVLTDRTIQAMDSISRLGRIADYH